MTVVSAGSVKLRLETSTSGLDILRQEQFAVCAEGLWAVVSWEEDTLPRRAGLVVLGIVHSELPLPHRAGSDALCEAVSALWSMCCCCGRW